MTTTQPDFDKLPSTEVPSPDDAVRVAPVIGYVLVGEAHPDHQLPEGRQVSKTHNVHPDEHAVGWDSTVPTAQHWG